MGKGIRYTVALNQAVVHDYSVLDLSKRLGCTNKSLYGWIKKVQQTQGGASRGRPTQTRADTHLAIFEYIELFYNSKRRHTQNGRLASTVYEYRISPEMFEAVKVAESTSADETMSTVGDVGYVWCAK